MTMHIFGALLLLPSLLGPFSAATNHADDILGSPDSRQGTWGPGWLEHAQLPLPPARRLPRAHSPRLWQFAGLDARSGRAWKMRGRAARALMFPTPFE